MNGLGSLAATALAMSQRRAQMAGCIGRDRAATTPISRRDRAVTMRLSCREHAETVFQLSP